MIFNKKHKKKIHIISSIVMVLVILSMILLYLPFLL